MKQVRRTQLPENFNSNTEETVLLLRHPCSGVQRATPHAPDLSSSRQPLPARWEPFPRGWVLLFSRPPLDWPHTFPLLPSLPAAQILKSNIPEVLSDSERSQRLLLARGLWRKHTCKPLAQEEFGWVVLGHRSPGHRGGAQGSPPLALGPPGQGRTCVHQAVSGHRDLWPKACKPNARVSFVLGTPSLLPPQDLCFG